MQVIITGAAHGIGKSITYKCIQEGYYVHACDIDENGLQNLKQDIPDFYGQIHCIDVTNEKDCKELFDNLNSIDTDTLALVNNAGIYLGKNLLDYTIDEIDKVLNINIKGAIYFSKYFAKKVFDTTIQGKIINITSVSGQEGSSDAIYGTSKAALLGLTKSCAMNFAPRILVNAIAPTMVNTKMMSTIPDWRKTEYNNHNLIKEEITGDDIADTVLFLLSDKANHYTGATFDINNGGYLR